MGNWKYRKPEPTNVQGPCVICGNPQRTAKWNSSKFQALCRRCDDERYGQFSHNRDMRRKPYRKAKKSYCEKCGFVAEHPVQLDVDHIDGNHQNNDFGNLQTLCANCHRLKTMSENKKRFSASAHEVFRHASGGELEHLHPVRGSAYSVIA